MNIGRAAPQETKGGQLLQAVENRLLFKKV